MKIRNLVLNVSAFELIGYRKLQIYVNKVEKSSLGGWRGT